MEDHLRSHFKKDLVHEYGFYGIDKPKNYDSFSKEIIEELKLQSSQRLLLVGQALREETLNEIHNVTKYDKWFIKQISEVVDLEKLLLKHGLDKNNFKS